MEDKSVFWNLELSIKPGKLDDLNSLAGEMSDATKANEPNAIDYVWSIDGDNNDCHIFERYMDSDAVRTHLGNFQAFAERFFDCMDIKAFNVYGNPDPALIEAMSAMGCRFYGRFSGFER